MTMSESYGLLKLCRHVRETDAQDSIKLEQRSQLVSNVPTPMHRNGLIGRKTIASSRITMRKDAPVYLTRRFTKANSEFPVAYELGYMFSSWKERM
jgi:hypothetical protein